MHQPLNSFHCSALKAGSSTEVHIPEWTKKDIYTKHVSSQTFLATYPYQIFTQERHEIPPKAQVMSCSQAGMGGYSSTIPQLLCRPQIPGACSFMANWQLLFPREDMWLARLTISGFAAQSCCWPGEAAQVWDLLCLQVKALRAIDRLCLAKKPYSPFASFSSILRATSPSTATRCKRANHGRKWVSSMGVQIS